MTKPFKELRDNMTEEQKANSEEKYKMLTDIDIIYLVIRTEYYEGSGPNYDDHIECLEAWVTEEQALKACVDYQKFANSNLDLYGADEIEHSVKAVVLRGV